MARPIKKCLSGKKEGTAMKHFEAICPDCAEKYTLISDGITINGKCKCGHLSYAFINQSINRKELK
jgi:hypothetical protein